MYLGLRKERDRRADIIKRLESDPRYKYMLPPSATQTRVVDEEADETFRNLQSMVEETAAMARAAVNCDQDEARFMLQSLENRYLVYSYIIFRSYIITKSGLF